MYEHSMLVHGFSYGKLREPGWRRVRKKTDNPKVGTRLAAQRYRTTGSLKLKITLTDHGAVHRQ